jgi:signal transduction histidine kinase
MAITKLKIKRITALLLLMFTAVLFIAPQLVPQTAEASLGLCKTLGPGLSPKNDGSRDVTASYATNRKWTVQELFSSSVDFTAYNGETGTSTENDWILKDTKSQHRGSSIHGYAAAKPNLEKQRNLNCLIAGVATVFPDLWINLSSAVIGIVQKIVTMLFNPNYICSDPANPTGGCINLIGIIGGKSDTDGGIIGTLFTGIYEPLIVLAFVLTGLWLMYKGLIKRELRASMSGLLWSLLIFIIGVMAMTKPQMLASAPQKINSTIGSCIVGAMNGQNCMDGSITAPSSLVGPECRSDGDTNGDDGAAMAVNGMSCSIWKSFVLDSWAKAQFGRNYQDLYLGKSVPEGAQGNIYENDPGAGEDAKMTVHLGSSESADAMGSNITLNQDVAIANIALYQLYLRSGITDSKNTSSMGSHPDDYDGRWFHIINLMAQDNTSWPIWAGAAGQGTAKNYAGFTSLIISIIAGASLVIFAFWGMMYSFAGTILMAFSPLFFLVAVVPGKGKRIFLGWLEAVVSSTLKYMASALFVIVALAMYSGVLNNTTNQASAFIGIIVMVGVLFTYRKEVVNLLGMANLGGEKMSNAVGEKIRDKAQNAKEMAAMGIGAGVGAKAAGGTFRSGAVQGTIRRMSRDNNFMGGAARQGKITHDKIDSERKKAQANAEAEKKEKEKEAKEKATKEAERKAEEERQKNLLARKKFKVKRPEKPDPPTPGGGDGKTPTTPPGGGGGSDGGGGTPPPGGGGGGGANNNPPTTQQGRDGGGQSPTADTPTGTPPITPTEQQPIDNNTPTGQTPSDKTTPPSRQQDDAPAPSQDGDGQEPAKPYVRKTGSQEPMATASQDQPTRQEPSGDGQQPNVQPIPKHNQDPNPQPQDDYDYSQDDDDFEKVTPQQSDKPAPVQPKPKPVLEPTNPREKPILQQHQTRPSSHSGDRGNLHNVKIRRNRGNRGH